MDQRVHALFLSGGEMHKIKLYYGARLYSNRIIGETLPDPNYTFENINFVLGDGISTYQVLNNVNSEESPSYLTAEDEDGNVTEWFVVDSNKERKSQLSLSLKRDFLDEDWDVIKHQPFICTKSATIPDAISDAKYRKTMNLSQVKSHEYKLAEDDGNGWIVIYFNRVAGDNAPSDPWTTEITAPSTGFKVTLAKNHDVCENSPCDILLIPLGGTMHFRDGTAAMNLRLSTLRAALELTYAISERFGSYIADMQYLPYTPYTRMLPSISSASNESFSQILNESGSVVSFAIWTFNAYFTKTISKQAIAPDITIPTDNLGQRKYNEEHMFRLCSPNYASSFEFSPVKNNGTLTFRIYGILRPLSPYIYVEPSFTGLYGKPFEDGRGMILSGDFSLDQISSAWTEYKLQNKNYQLTFDRQIQSMDLANNIANQEAGWNIAHSVTGGIAGIGGGAAGGAALGAAIGSVVMPGVGTVIGGLAGAAGGAKLSAAAGGVDIAETVIKEKNAKSLRDDTKQAAIDNFQYQIGNIQAIPNTLNKVSAINQNFKIFPILEQYDCTPQESTNVDNSIRYNGLDINLMTTLSVFDSGYIQGSILQFPSNLHINESQAQAINSELQYGIYYKEV